MRNLLLPALALLALSPLPAHAERVRDLGTFQGVRSNQLTGYGIVVGLAGTGDDNLEYLSQAMRGVSGRLGVTLPPGVSPSLKNAAAVLVTADIPAFAKPGQRIDVTVSTLGKAKSLRGGALILAPLYGADGQIYAMAQGNLAVGGLGVSARDGSQLTVNVPTVGRIAEGASVERAVATGFASGEILRFNLFNADFMTAQRVREQLDSLGASDTKIVVTSDLDEFAIAGLAPAPVDAYGVGTNLVVGSGHPTCGFVYKLVARADDDGTMRSVAKRSASKTSIGGKKIAARRYDGRGTAVAELVGIDHAPGADDDPATTERELLVDLVTDGRVVGREPLQAARDRHAEAITTMPLAAQRLSAGQPAIETVFV